MITERAVLEDPSALRSWFPALSGSSGISVTSFTVYLAEAPSKCQSLWTISPLSHLRTFSFHPSLPGHRVPEHCGRGCFQCTLMFLPSHMSGGSILPLGWTVWPRRKMNSNCIMSSRRWMGVRGNMVLWAVSGPCSSVALHCCICFPVFTNGMKSRL